MPRTPLYHAINNSTAKPVYMPIRLLLKTALFPAAALLSLPGAAETETAPQLTEVVVTATYLERRPEQIAGTVTAVTAEQIRQTLSDDLGDVIRYQPGISMDTAARGGNEGISIRGIGGNRVLTVIDGIRSSDLYAAGPSSYGKDSFEVDDLKSVEIIRGPASVLYGADALGGVVALQTRDARDYLRDGDPLHIALRSSGNSSNDQLKTGLTLAQQTGQFGNVLQLTRRDFSETDVKGPGSLNPQDGGSRNLFLKSSWEPDAQHTLSLSLDNYQQSIRTHLLSELNSSVNTSEGTDKTDRNRLSLRHQWRPDAALADTVTTQLSWLQTDADQQTIQQRTSFSFINPRNPASFRGTAAERFTSLQFNQDTRNLQVIARKDTLVYGLSFEQTDTERPRDRLDTRIDTGETTRAIPSYPMAAPEVFPNKTFPDTETRRQGIFAQQEIALLDDRLLVIPGLRYDHYKMTPRLDAMFTNSGDISDWGGQSVQRFSESNVSANLGVLFSLTDQVSLFGQYAEGFRPPNFDEANQAFVNLGHGYATIPNPGLRAETSQAFELGARARIGNTRLNMAVFDNRYDDFIESSLFSIQDGIQLFQDANIGKARIYGLEASFDWAVSDALYWRSALFLSRGRDQIQDTELNSVDPVTLVSGLRYQRDERWAVEGVATLVAGKSRVAAPGQVKGEAYQVFDVMGHYNITDNTSLRAGVFNLLDEQYAPWSRIAGLAAADTQTLANSQAPGRHVRLALDVTF